MRSVQSDLIVTMPSWKEYDVMCVQIWYKYFKFSLQVVFSKLHTAKELA